MLCSGEGTETKGWVLSSGSLLITLESQRAGKIAEAAAQAMPHRAWMLCAQGKSGSGQ